MENAKREFRHPFVVLVAILLAVGICTLASSITTEKAWAASDGLSGSNSIRVVGSGFSGTSQGTLETSGESLVNAINTLDSNVTTMSNILNDISNGGVIGLVGLQPNMFWWVVDTSDLTEAITVNTQATASGYQFNGSFPVNPNTRYQIVVLWLNVAMFTDLPSNHDEWPITFTPQGGSSQNVYEQLNTEKPPMPLAKYVVNDQYPFVMPAYMYGEPGKYTTAAVTWVGNTPSFSNKPNWNGPDTEGSGSTSDALTSNGPSGYIPSSQQAQKPIIPSSTVTTWSISITPTNPTTTIIGGTISGNGDQVYTPSRPHWGGGSSTPTGPTTVAGFSDVLSNAWYANDVAIANLHGLMVGWVNDKGQKVFGPTDPLTRAEAATILWRYAEPEEASSYDASTAVNSTPWTDASSHQFYTGALNWAYDNDVLNGYAGSNLTGPDDPLTREQMCAILYNFSTTRYDVSTDGANPSSYATATDQQSVSPWAQDVVGWAFHNDIMTGKQPGNVLAATDVTNRAEGAKMFVYTLGGLIGWDK